MKQALWIWYTNWLRRSLERQIMADLSKLNAAVASLDQKVTSLLALPPTTVEDPAVQASIDAATSAVEAIGQKIDAAHPGI